MIDDAQAIGSGRGNRVNCPSSMLHHIREGRVKIPFLSKARKNAYLPKLQASSGDTVYNFFFPMFWWTTDSAKFLKLMQTAVEQVASGAHFADNFFTWGRNNSMLEDGEFMKSWNANVESETDKAIVWRRYVLACAAFHCVQLKGDFVECGAYTGVGVKTVVDYLGGADFPKAFWLYDLFEHEESMLHHAMPDHGPDLYQRVLLKFQRYPQVRIIKGHIPEAFEGQSPARIAYLHIDMNEAPAEIAALEALFDRVVPGGIVVLDDYEWAGIYRAQKQAEDPWFEARGYRVFPLPTGQGLVIKR